MDVRERWFAQLNDKGFKESFQSHIDHALNCSFGQNLEKLVALSIIKSQATWIQEPSGEWSTGKLEITGSEINDLEDFVRIKIRELISKNGKSR